MANVMRSEVDVGMRQKSRFLLVIDGVMNILLGTLLLLFPAGVLDLLGLPETSTHFYPSILGAVLVGIGVALFIEVHGARRPVTGLGLAGAIAINIFGGGALLVWLLVAELDMPTRGHIVLWCVAVAVLTIGVFELLARPWRYDGQDA